jgi:hypothetical protein
MQFGQTLASERKRRRCSLGLAALAPFVSGAVQGRNSRSICRRLPMNADQNRVPGVTSPLHLLTPFRPFTTKPRPTGRCTSEYCACALF